MNDWRISTGCFSDKAEDAITIFQTYMKDVDIDIGRDVTGECYFSMDDVVRDRYDERGLLGHIRSVIPNCLEYEHCFLLLDKLNGCSIDELEKKYEKELIDEMIGIPLNPFEIAQIESMILEADDLRDKLNAIPMKDKTFTNSNYTDTYRRWIDLHNLIEEMKRRKAVFVSVPMEASIPSHSLDYKPVYVSAFSTQPDFWTIGDAPTQPLEFKSIYDNALADSSDY